MSMRDYAVDDYGLLLDDETIKIIASKVFDDFEEVTESISWGYELYEKGIAEYIGEFVGEAQMLNEDGVYAYGCDYRVYTCEDIVYVPTSKYPTLFKRAYNNTEEIVEEFKSKLCEYLPEDFDYRSKICHISGTYYG